MALTKIPGNLIETGAITGDVLADGGIATAKLADDAVTTDKILDANITHAKLHATMDLTGKTVTVATAAGSTNTTAAASTAFVQQELTTLIGGAPGTLDTLNELAAAINDDSNYNSTLTTALATKLPLAGGTMTGGLVVTAGNGDQLLLDNAGERFTQIGLKHSGAQNGALWLDDTDGMVDLYANTSHGIRLKTGGDNPRVTILSGGNVGIGTDSPDYKLDVEGSGNGLVVARVKNVTGGTTARADMVVESDTADIRMAATSSQYTGVAGWADTGIINTSSGTSGGMLFNVQGNYPYRFMQNATTERMRIHTDGNVGIGTPSPVSTLDVRSTNAVGSVFRKDFNGPVADTFSKVAVTLWGQDHDDAAVGTGTDQFGPMLGFGARIDDGNPNSGDIRAGISYSYNGDLTFHAKAGASVADGSYERIRIDGATGNVGIGTTNPAQPLHVLSSTALTAGVARFQYSGGNDYEVIRVESLGNNDAHIGFFADGDTNYYGGFGIDYSDAGKFKLQTDNLFVGGSNLMTWDRDRKVGINNTGPTVNLDVYNPSGWGGIDIDGTSGGELRFQRAGTNYGQIYGNDSSGFVVNALGGLEQLNLQAGGTNLLYLKKSTETVTVLQGKLKTSVTNAIIKKSCNFSNGVANQKVDFYIQPNYWGNITVSITSSYSNQNAPGVLTKQFGVGLNPSGNIYSNESKITEELGYTATNFAISDIVWDASPADGSGIGKYKFTIVHRVSNGNSCELTITGNAAATPEIDNLCAMTQSAVYTTDTTVYNKQTRDVAFFSTAAAQALTATPTKINFNTNVFDEGGNMSNGVFTAPQKGVYTFQVNYLVYPHSDGIITTWFYKNGSQYGPGIQMGWDGGSHTQISNGTLINLDKGDTVDHRAARGGGTGTPNVYGGQNCFYGHII